MFIAVVKVVLDNTMNNTSNEGEQDKRIDLLPTNTRRLNQRSLPGLHIDPADKPNTVLATHN